MRTLIPGATGAQFTPTDAQLGKRLVCDVTTSNSAGEATASTLPTEAVQEAEPGGTDPNTLFGDGVDPAFTDQTNWVDD